MTTDAELLRKTNALLARYERTIARDIVASKNRYIRRAAEEFVTYGTIENSDLFLQHRNEMTQSMSKRMLRIIQDFGLLVDVPTRSEGLKLARRVGLDEAQSFFEYLRLEWLSLYGTVAIQNTAATTRSDISRAIAAGFTENKPTREIARDILKVRGISRFRANTIARTETHNAAMFASKESAVKVANDAGIEGLKKKWIPVQDERTRISHSAMSSHPIINVDSQFSVGGESADRPGDRALSAANSINCRCVLRFIS